MGRKEAMLANFPQTEAKTCKTVLTLNYPFQVQSELSSVISFAKKKKTTNNLFTLQLLTMSADTMSGNGWTTYTDGKFIRIPFWSEMFVQWKCSSQNRAGLATLR